MYPKYKSRLGYATGDNKIDSYGVDHSGFTTRDELEYQRARTEREQQLIQEYNRRGIANNYPQYGTNFWGNPANNYGFGSSDIHDNIENMQGQPLDVRQKSGFGNNRSALQGICDKNFDRVFNRTLEEEGGYEDKPNKIDTATNFGFQQATLERFKNKHPELARNFPEHVKDLTREQGKIIACKDYYEPYRIGEIQSHALQETMFDSFFNHSPAAPALWAQKAINQNTKIHVDEDGIFGSETINALNKLSRDEIVEVNNAILTQRLKDYEQEKETNSNPYYKRYSVGLPDRFERFRIE